MLEREFGMNKALLNDIVNICIKNNIVLQIIKCITLLCIENKKNKIRVKL